MFGRALRLRGRGRRRERSGKASVPGPRLEVFGKFYGDDLVKGDLVKGRLPRPRLHERRMAGLSAALGSEPRMDQGVADKPLTAVP